ncbi:hypothetical protein HPB49_011430 [Dermacentor silvarum]|uniref:Uncharacterized protein n=1 Tax=Dermacentor silvarum TaxID=543639 RepID=A0ACB8C3B1_DERSI|nr:hypothetical protein HPB49_011430 [Dermacentor silvarum]
MLTLNIELSDGLVNGSVGHLKHVQFDEMGLPKCVWLHFHCRATDNIARQKANPIRELAGSVVPVDSVPIELRTATVTLDRRTGVSCGRKHPTTLHGHYLTNAEDDFTFYHCRENPDRALLEEFPLCNINVCSLPAHAFDVSHDHVVREVPVLCLQKRGQTLPSNCRVTSALASYSDMSAELLESPCASTSAEPRFHRETFPTNSTRCPI